MKILSLRARILLGAIFWMTALFVASGMVLTHLMSRNPRAPGMFHRIFVHMDVLGVVVVVCLGAGLLLVRRGLSSFDELRVAAARRSRRAGRAGSKATIPARSCRSCRISTACSTIASSASRAR